MRGFLSNLKKTRIAAVIVGVGAMLAGTTVLSSAAYADRDGRGHGGRHYDRGDRGDRGHGYRHHGGYRGDRHYGGHRHHGHRHHRHGHGHYYPSYYYSPGYYDYYPAYTYAYPAPGVSFGFNFR